MITISSRPAWRPSCAKNRPAPSQVSLLFKVVRSFLGCDQIGYSCPGFQPPTSGSGLFPRPRFLQLLLACGDQAGDVEAERFAVGNLLARGPDGSLDAVRDLVLPPVHPLTVAPDVFIGGGQRVIDVV